MTAQLARDNVSSWRQAPIEGRASARMVGIDIAAPAPVATHAIPGLKTFPSGDTGLNNASSYIRPKYVRSHWDNMPGTNFGSARIGWRARDIAPLTCLGRPNRILDYDRSAAAREYDEESATTHSAHDVSRLTPAVVAPRAPTSWPPTARPASQ
jgi:hypothetical protein